MLRVLRRCDSSLCELEGAGDSQYKFRDAKTDRTQASVSSPVLARLASLSNSLSFGLSSSRLPMAKSAKKIGRSWRRKARLQYASARTSFAMSLSGISTPRRILTVRVSLSRILRLGK